MSRILITIKKILKLVAYTIQYFILIAFIKNRVALFLINRWVSARNYKTIAIYLIID